MFKVGDKVTAFGVKGTVLRVLEDDQLTTKVIQVGFVEAGENLWFTKDGKLSDWNKYAVLTLIEPPKRKVKKTMFVAITTKPCAGSTRGGHATSYAHIKREDVVDSFFSDHQIVEVQIEVEE